MRKLDWIARHGGMALLDTHPDYMAFQGASDPSVEYPVERYREFLHYVQDKYSKTCWQALPREVTSYVLDMRNTQLRSETASIDLNGWQPQPSAIIPDLQRSPGAQGVAAKKDRRLHGKKVAVLLFSNYPADPRPRRAAEALTREGAIVDLLCMQQNERERRHENVNGVNVSRLPFRRYRGGKLAYIGQYSAFILISFVYLTIRSLRKRYDFIHVHNMPDVLVFSALVPKLLGAKVVLDLHDPMPELMEAIFNLSPQSVNVRVLKQMEKWSIGFADRVVTVSRTFKDLFSARSCPAEKIAVVLNSPDERIFRFRPCRPFRRDENDGSKPFVILYHGSLLRRNGFDLAVDALERLRNAVPVARLVVCGSRTAFFDEVMASAQARGLDKFIEYRGSCRLERIVEAIASCDVGVIPNHKNIFTELNTPTRIFECLALGKPVIAPRARGIQDYFGDDDLIYFNLGDSEDLADKLEFVVRHPRDVAEIVERGQQVYQNHTWTGEKANLLNCFTDLV